MSARLRDWQGRLDAHFRTLRTERDRFEPGRPLFALEHALDPDQDLPDLSDAVKASVADRVLSESYWLPFVVYAAEVGYRYRGDEYWPVFDAETPNWKQCGSGRRLYIREKYKEFAETYGGAVPSGVWAAWFKNIAWPITHAILPTDLQRHLARLLYDYRRALTNDLLKDHRALGERLACRCENTSSRFRTFAENTPLLGLVAMSLLLGDEDDSPLLLKSTLHRIIADLNHERQAGAWLRDAKKAAVTVRCRGFLSGTASTLKNQELRSRSESSWQNLELALTIRRGSGGWSVYVTVPSHGSLAQRHPDVRRDLERVRYRIRGTQRVQPRGALMYQRGPLPLCEWPSSHETVLAAEGGSDELSQLLIDSCRFPGGPWLFRLLEPGLGSEIRTNSVRPGRQYILLNQENPPVFADLCEPVALRTKGVAAVQLDIPDQVDAKVIAELRQLGVGMLSDVRVWPAGLVPAGWDGEGQATWPAGEDPIIGIESSRSATTCVVATELEFAKLDWPEDSNQLFVQFGGFETGSHRLDVTLLEQGGDTVAEGQLQLRILEPADSSTNLGARQGLVVHSYPSRPTFEELWTGSASIAADGPRDGRVLFSVALMTRGGRKTLAQASFSSLLPVVEDRWRELFRSAQGSESFTAALDDAEELVVSASNSVLGMSQIRAERPFTPLRWCAGQDQDGPFAWLIDHMDAEDLVIECYDAQHPADVEQRTIDDVGQLRIANGGLLVGRCSGLSASIVLSPHVSGGLESLRRLNVRPSIQTGSRSADSVKKMIRLSRLWTSATVSADTFAGRLQSRVNNAIVAHLGAMIGGVKWQEVEIKAVAGQLPKEQQLIDVAGRSPWELKAARSLVEASQTVGPEPTERIAALGDVLGTPLSGVDRSLAGPVLRLATVPGSLSLEDPLATLSIDAVLKQPVVYRLARLFVLVLKCRDEQSGSASTLRTWSWE